MAPRNTKVEKPLSRAQSSAVGSVTLATERRLLFASEYFFKPQGLAYISKEFENQLGARKSPIKLKYDPLKYTFMITCDPGESKKIWKIFFTILTTMVNEECRKSNLMRREECSPPSSDDEDEDADDDDDDNDDDDDDDDENNDDDDESESFDEDLILRSDKIERLDVYKARQATIGAPVQNSNHRFIHKYMWRDESLDLNDVFTDSLLYELSELTKCSFSKELGKQCIYIGSQNEASYHAVIAKLNNIKKYFRPLTQFSYHSFYTEADLIAEFALLRFSTVKNRYCRTTLIDDLDLNVQGLSIEYPDLLEKAITVRCASYDRASASFRINWKLKVVPVIKEKDRGHTTESQKILKPSSRGTKNGDIKPRNSNNSKSMKVSSTKTHKQNNLTHHDSVLLGDNLKISNWVQDVVESTPLVLQGINNSNMNESNQQHIRSKIPGKPSWDLFQEALPPKREEIQDGKPVENLHRDSDLNSADLRSHKSELETKHKTEKRSILSSSGLSCVVRKNTDLDSKSQLPETHSNLHKYSKLSLVLPSPPNLMDDDIPNLQTQILTPGSNNLLTDQNTQGNQAIKHKTNEISCNKKKTEAINASLKEKLSEESKNIHKFSYAHPSRRGAHSKRPPKSENELEPDMNIQTLVCKGNLSGKSNPSPLSKLSAIPCTSKDMCDPTLLDSVIESLGSNVLDKFGQELCTCFWQMMAHLCAYRGELIVEVNFGRIISHGIHDAFVSNKGVSEKTFQEEKVRTLLMKTSSITSASNYTKILTCIPAEIQYIIDMKDTHGSKYWSPRINESSFSYELHFIDKNASHYTSFIVEIDAEKLTSKIKNSKQLGNIYVHGTKRFWDFRISATGTDTENGHPAKYNELQEMISSLLFIPDKCTRPDVTIEMKYSYADNYWLEKVNVRHIEKYLSRDNQSILHISEIESLGVSFQKSPEENSIIFKAFSYKDMEKEYPSNLRSWFEVSTSSRMLNSYLKKHEMLELGEVVYSTAVSPESRSIARSLYIPACWMLERMDGVGFYNDNGFDLRRPTTISSAPKPQTRIVSYW